MDTFIRLEYGLEDRVSERFGPFSYAQLTYDILRVGDNDETFAEYHEGYWMRPDDDVKWSDVIIWGEI